VQRRMWWWGLLKGGGMGWWWQCAAALRVASRKRNGVPIDPSSRHCLGACRLPGSSSLDGLYKGREGLARCVAWRSPVDGSCSWMGDAIV
jgi:hypothetical protein